MWAVYVVLWCLPANAYRRKGVPEFYVFLQSSSKTHVLPGEMERDTKEHLCSLWMSCFYNPDFTELCFWGIDVGLANSPFPSPLKCDWCGVCPASTFGKCLKSTFCFDKITQVLVVAAFLCRLNTYFFWHFHYISFLFLCFSLSHYNADVLNSSKGVKNPQGLSSHQDNSRRLLC